MAASPCASAGAQPAQLPAPVDRAPVCGKAVSPPFVASLWPPGTGRLDGRLATCLASRALGCSGAATGRLAGREHVVKVRVHERAVLADDVAVRLEEQDGKVADVALVLEREVQSRQHQVGLPMLHTCGEHSTATLTESSEPCR